MVVPKKRRAASPYAAHETPVQAKHHAGAECLAEQRHKTMIRIERW
jgi:hypothetical protein